MTLVKALKEAAVTKDGEADICITAPSFDHAAKDPVPEAIKTNLWRSANGSDIVNRGHLCSVPCEYANVGLEEEGSNVSRWFSGGSTSCLYTLGAHLNPS